MILHLILLNVNTNTLFKDKVITIKGFYALYFGVIFIIMAVAPLPLIASSTAIPISEDSDDVFLIKDEQSGEIERVSERDYIIGVMAGEMDPDSHKEALKAQAVAAYTYALYKRNARLEKGYEYDLSSGHSSDQEYLKKSEQVALWQDQYSQKREILESIANEVYGIAITFGGKPILAVYHSVSSGKTEAAASVWGGNYPYLQSVISDADLLSPEYKSILSYSAFDFADKALDLGVTLVGAPSSWLGESTRGDGGYVTKYILAGHEISGVDMRSAYLLPSANFELEYLNEKFIFTVKGHGHGVGMSQFGAKYMAEQGSSFEQILEYYYPGTVVEKIVPNN